MDYRCIGEPLIELTSLADMPLRFDRRAGRDTLNMAVYLARLSAAGSVGYLSRPGDDAISAFLHGTLAEEDITDHCAAQAGGRPGLSFINHRYGRRAQLHLLARPVPGATAVLVPRRASPAGPGRDAGPVRRHSGDAAAPGARRLAAGAGTAPGRGREPCPGYELSPVALA